MQLPLESGWVVQGPYVAEFERRFAEFTGAAHAAAASSCTTALHLAVVALGLKRGDEVIVPGFTWVSTANVVEYLGARPVFCDVDLKTFNLDVEQLESLVTDRTAGIVPVHLFGLCADMGPVLELAARHGLWVLEDAACALGSTWHGRHAGTIGDMGASPSTRASRSPPARAAWSRPGAPSSTRSCALSATTAHPAPTSTVTRAQAPLLSDYRESGSTSGSPHPGRARRGADAARADVIERRRHVAERTTRRSPGLEWLRTPVVRTATSTATRPTSTCTHRRSRHSRTSTRSMRDETTT